MDDTIDLQLPDYTEMDVVAVPILNIHGKYILQFRYEDCQDTVGSPDIPVGLVGELMLPHWV